MLATAVADSIRDKTGVHGPAIDPAPVMIATFALQPLADLAACGLDAAGTGFAGVVPGGGTGERGFRPPDGFRRHSFKLGNDPCVHEKLHDVAGSSLDPPHDAGEFTQRLCNRDEHPRADKAGGENSRRGAPGRRASSDSA